MEKTSFVAVGKSRLTYRIYGKGTQHLLAFHGFGQTGRVFSTFERAFPTHTIYSFDLFCFGGSLWKERENVLSPAFWKGLMEAFLNKEKIDRFSLVGFSLGAKLLLLSYEQFSSNIEGIHLIAPDGIARSIWYQAATQYALTNACFRFTIRYPQPFNGLLRVIQFFSLVDHRTVSFAIRQMDSYEKRKTVYDAWMLYRNIKPSMPQVTSLLNRTGTPVTIFIGKSDKMLGKNKLKPMLDRLSDALVIELAGGHSRLVEKAAQWLAADND